MALNNQIDFSNGVPAVTPFKPPPVTANPAIPSQPVNAPPIHPEAPAPAPDFTATAANPLAAMSTYQPQTNYSSPEFRGSSSFQQGNYAAPTIAAPDYQAGNTQAQQVNATPATAGQFDVNAFRPFADAVYSEATRQLDPQFQSQENAFRQRMVNQGIQEGTSAFDTALANFERSRNDAYSQARNQSLAQALGAQNQFFGQNLANSQMGLQAGLANASNALQAAGLNQADRQFGASQGLQGQLANAQMQMQAQQLGQADRQFGAQNQLAYDQLANAFNQRNSEFGAQLGQADRQFGANYDYQQQRADMQDLMALLGYGQQADMYNNQLLGIDQQRAGALFGLIPGLTPTQLDVQGTINTGASINQSNAANAQAAQNAMYQAVGQMAGGAMMMSDRRMKTDISRVGELDNGLPVYRFRYKHGGPMQIGVMAQDVEKVNPKAVAELGGIKHVNYAEAVQ